MVDQRFEPARYTSDRDVPTARSQVDYLVRRLAVDYRDPDTLAGAGRRSRNLPPHPRRPAPGPAWEAPGACVMPPLTAIPFDTGSLEGRRVGRPHRNGDSGGIPAVGRHWITLHGT
jgi:hypothetical protein